jgi:hypothetical protein
MIVKHFYRNEWQLERDWENTDHVFGAPDSDTQVEQTEKSIAASLKISDNKQSMEEEDDDDQRLSLPSYRQGKASPWRAKEQADKISLKK